MRISIVAFSTNGCRTAMRIKNSMPEHDFTLACKTTSDTLGLHNIEGRTIDWVGQRFTDSDALVFIGAIGIAVRYIAPYVKRKDKDPAVICLDEHGEYTIPILSGHRRRQPLGQGVGRCHRVQGDHHHCYRHQR